MSQHIQGTNSSSADLPMKRKRGRPRKDESLLQGENMNFMPGSDTARKNKFSASTIEKVQDDMVGQVVSGVIEGSFDAGYLLNVKVGDTDTQLRGVVFLPGKFVPITPANDVAPHVPMWQRKEIPIPAPGSSSQSRPSKNPSVEHSAPVFPSQVPPFELQSPAETETASGKQPASVLPPPADNLSSFVGITAQTQQPTSESGLDISLPEQNNKQTAEFDGSALMLKDHVPSYKLEYPNPTASDRQPASAMPKNDMCPPFEHKIIMQQTLDSGLEIPASEHAMKKFLVLKDHGPVFPGQVPCLGVQPAVSMTLDSQSASVSLPLIDSFAKNGGGSSFEVEVGLQQTSESGPEIPPSVSKQSMGLKNQGIFSDQGPPFEIQSALSMELDNQPASATALADDSSKNDVPSSSEGNPLKQQTSEPEFGISSTIQENKQALELNSNTPVHAEQISPFALQLGTYATLDKHPTSESHLVPQEKSLPGNVTFPSWEGQLMAQPTLEFGLEIHPLEQGKQQPIDQGASFELQSATSLKNDRGPYLEARVMQQQSLFSGFGNQPAAQMTQSGFDKVAEQDEVMQEFESSNFLKNPTIHMEVTKDVVELQPASEPSFDKLPLTGTGGSVPEIEFPQQGADSGFKLNASVHAEEKKLSTEHAAEGQGAGNDLGLRIGCEAADRQNL